MHPDNPGADLYRTKVHIARTRESAAGMGEAVKAMARLALKLYGRVPLGTPQEEGYIPTGRRVHFVAEQTAAQRALDMLVKKISGQPYRHRVAHAELQPGEAGAAGAGPSPR